MKPASNQLSNYSFKFEVLLDIGSSSDSFYYLDGNDLGVEVGDIVIVKLKGRLLNGLVISKEKFSMFYIDGEITARKRTIKYLFVEGILHKKIIDDWWRELLESLASFYMVSNLKMFKTAFPPGWIGKHKKISQGLKDQIWIGTKKELDIRKNKFTNLEFSLINTLPKK